MLDLSRLNPVETEPGRPLYQIVRDTIRHAIDVGELRPGTRLPSTKAISEQLEVSLVTVHRALQELVSSGVLRRGQGRGTFVHEEYHQRTATSTGLRFGLVFHGESSLADSYHGQILEGVRQGSADLGIDLVLLRFGEDWRNECQGYLYVNPFEDQLDKSPRFGARAGDPTAGRRPPTMIVGATFERPGVSMVDTDNFDIARQAVLHLVGLGHTRIGFVGGSDQSSNSTDRWRGFTETCGECAVDLDDRFIIREQGWRMTPPRVEALTKLLARSDRPTAFFAAGYYFALDMYSGAKKAGLEIPRDLSLVGVDDPPSAAHLSPPLTTLRQPLVEMGRHAARTLFDQIGDSNPVVQRTTLSGILIVRGSTAPIE